MLRLARRSLARTWWASAYNLIRKYFRLPGTGVRREVSAPWAEYPTENHCPVSFNVSAFFTDVTPGTVFAISVALSI
ncbi:hypothetical protein SAMN02787142_0736 [Burkholderia sp. WP9]|nr:hypothetical protein SAMN02787142_0736 [Burkholderia sp. WP9]